MYSKWTQHLNDPEEKSTFQKKIFSSRAVLERLGEILQEESNSLDRSETDPKNYDTPNWAYKQAHKNGYRQSLSIIQKLINLDQQKENIT